MGVALRVTEIGVYLVSAIDGLRRRYMCVLRVTEDDKVYAYETGAKLGLSDLHIHDICWIRKVIKGPLYPTRRRRWCVDRRTRG